MQLRLEAGLELWLISENQHLYGTGGNNDLKIHIHRRRKAVAGPCMAAGEELRPCSSDALAHVCFRSLPAQIRMFSF